MSDTEKTNETAQDALSARYEDGSNADREDPRKRARFFKLIFRRDIFKPKGFLDQESVKGKVLDLGSGKGALGIFLKEVNPEIEITGTDPVDYSDKGLVSGPYSQITDKAAVPFLQEA